MKKKTAKRILQDLESIQYFSSVDVLVEKMGYEIHAQDHVLKRFPDRVFSLGYLLVSDPADEVPYDCDCDYWDDVCVCGMLYYEEHDLEPFTRIGFVPDTESDIRTLDEAVRLQDWRKLRLLADQILDKTIWMCIPDGLFDDPGHY